MLCFCLCWSRVKQSCRSVSLSSVEDNNRKCQEVLPLTDLCPNSSLLFFVICKYYTWPLRLLELWSGTGFKPVMSRKCRREGAVWLRPIHRSHLELQHFFSDSARGRDVRVKQDLLWLTEPYRQTWISWCVTWWPACHSLPTYCLGCSRWDKKHGGNC